MKPSPSSEPGDQDREIIKLLEALGSLKATYPPELLAARRDAFLAQVKGLTPADPVEDLSVEDQEIVKLLRNLKTVPAEYPPELLAARRSALLRQMERERPSSLRDQLRRSIQRIFPSKRTIPTAPPAGLMRLSLVIGSLLALILIGSLLFSRAEGSLLPSPSQAATPTHFLPTNTGEVALTICKPASQALSCPPGGLDPSQDLANSGNGRARPAVSNEAYHEAAYLNDGRGGASWVSNSPESWIKIDLGQVRTINTISLKNGSVGSSNEDTPGQFVIAVALSDVYADGDSSNDYVEYAQVFDSRRTGFSGSVSGADTIRTQFPPVKARFVKITFEKAGAAVEEVGVFMVQPPELANQPTRTPPYDMPGITLSPTPTDSLLAMDTASPVPSGTLLPTDTAFPTPTDTPTPLPTDTTTPIPTISSPSDTPISLPTAVPPTAIAPTAPPPPASTNTIVVTGNDQTLIFICNGNAVEIRGHANTVTLLGSCSNITVTGNGNRVFWRYGSPVITNTGNDNVIVQL